MNSIFDIFLNYGWGGILGIAAMGCIFLIIKYLNQQLGSQVKDGMTDIATSITSSMSNQNDKLITSINDTNKQLIDFVVNSHKENIDKHNIKLDKRIAVTEKVNQALKDILLYNNASRVMIFEFHNSSQNLSGIPFAKYSCNFEWFAPGQIAIGHECQALPFSTISSVVRELIDAQQDQIVYDNIDILENISPSLHSLLKKSHAQSVIYNAMYDSNNNLIGLLVLQFNTNIPEHVELHKLMVQTAQITSMLNLRNEFTQEQN